jgi:Phage portal protein, SPP1 Gp6-like
MPLVPQSPALYTPAWWLLELNRRLDVRLGFKPQANGVRTLGLDRWEDYYRGRLNLALASEKWRAEFAQRFPVYSANFMELVVDKHRERLQVQGIRFGDNTTTDPDAWRWWQDNHMDAESLKLHREALVKGSSYVLVWPADDGDREPEISVESPNEVIVATAPGKAWKRLAALKRYRGDDDRAHCEVYLPDGIWKYKSSQEWSGFSMTSWVTVANWEPERIAGEDWPIPNPYGVVPIVPFVHRPDLLNEGESKIIPVAANQDAVNKLRVDAFVASEFASFKQRWAIGIDIPVDPTTGEPVEPFRSAVDHLWVVPPPNPDQIPANGQAPQVAFGEFDVTPLGPFYDAIQGEIQMLGAISRTPYHYLLPQSGQPPSGDSLRAAEAGLVAEVVDDMVNLGESHEEVFRLNFRMRNDPRGKGSGAEIVWRDPETQSEGAHIDALVKMVTSLGVPKEAAWALIPGVTPQTIARWKRMALAEELSRPPTPAPFTLVPGGQPAGPQPPQLTDGQAPAAGAEPAR